MQNILERQTFWMRLPKLRVGEICLMQRYGGYRSGSVPGARVASNKAFSPDKVLHRGEFFQC